MRFMRNHLVLSGWSGSTEIATLVRSHHSEKAGRRVNPWFWSWIVLTVVFALGEAFGGELLVIPWAAGSATAAVLDALRFGVGLQWVAFALVGCVLTVLLRRFVYHKKE